MQVPAEAEEGVRFPRVTGNGELPDVAAENQTLLLCTGHECSNCRAVPRYS